MNLAVHGLEGDIQKATFYYDDPHKANGPFEFVMANPPFNLDEIDAEKMKNDPRLEFGLPVERKDRVRSKRTQRRLREMVEVIDKLEPRFGSALLAYAWYRSDPLPGFSGQTAMQLVRAGRADDVLDYIDAIDAGVHA